MRVKKVKQMGSDLGWNADAQSFEDSRWNTMNSIIWGVKYVSTNLSWFRFIVSCILQKFVKSFLYRSTHTNVIFIRAKIANKFGVQ